MSDSLRIDKTTLPAAQTARERVAADAKLQAAFVRAMTRREPSDVRPGSAAPPMSALDSVAGSTSAPQPDSEVMELVERFCAEMYVGETSHPLQPRLLLALQGGLMGASAEFVREGAFLRIRLRAGNDATFERMQSRRQTLLDAVTDHGSRSVTVEVIRDQEAGRDSAR